MLQLDSLTNLFLKSMLACFAFRQRLVPTNAHCTASSEQSCLAKLKQQCVLVKADCSQGKKAMSKLRFSCTLKQADLASGRRGEKLPSAELNGKKSMSQNSSSSSFMLDLKFRLGPSWLHSSANRVWRNVYVCVFLLSLLFSILIRIIREILFISFFSLSACSFFSLHSLMCASLGATNCQNRELPLSFLVVLYTLISRFVELRLNEWLNARVKRGTFR